MRDAMKPLLLALLLFPLVLGPGTSAAGPREDAAALSGALPRALDGWKRTRTNASVSGNGAFAFAVYTGPDGARVRLALGAGDISKDRVMEVASEGFTDARFYRGRWRSPKTGRRIWIAIVYPAGFGKAADAYLKAVDWASADRITGLPKGE